MDAGPGHIGWRCGVVCNLACRTRTALAIIAAYVLVGEMHRANGEYAQAFRKYQKLFGPFVLKKQKAAPRLAGTFAPSSKFAMFLRNGIFHLLSVRWVTDLAVGHRLADKIALPNYS
jgi:2-polyprenyl-6-methoxyphenol hydroxylase-like FAD-dependent oxidoreductase